MLNTYAYPVSECNPSFCEAYNMLLYGYSNKNRLVSDYETSSYNVYEAPTWSLQVRKIATSLTIETGEVC